MEGGENYENSDDGTKNLYANVWLLFYEYVLYEK